ncbi:MAG: SIS domain-containing protein [Emcibacter sp.]|nr:SIS domain-containing protein [Emcibacter sp.]
MTTIMEREAREAPARIQQQLFENRYTVKALGEKIRLFDPKLVMTVGRGTSDHAGVFAKYLIEVELGIPVTSSAPSVSSVYNKQMKLENVLVIFISQSGRSPDILAQAEMAKKSGAFCIALINDEAAPIKDIADAVIPLKAGAENAVAATKSYLTTLSALLQLVAYWSENNSILKALDSLPDQLTDMTSRPAQILPVNFKNILNCFVLGRGFGYAISLEIALKLKEVCCLHAEAFSSAEFFHGPVTLVEKEITILNININDEAAPLHQKMLDEIKARGARILPMSLPMQNVHPRLAPLLILERFYLDVELIARSLNINPDAPTGLRKVTMTV